MDPENKLCICKAIVNGKRKADYIACTISGTLPVDSSQNLLFITTYMLQFHNMANTTKQMPDWFHKHMYKTKDNKW